MPDTVTGTSILRRAAALMRKRAEAAEGFGPAWFAATDDETGDARVWTTNPVTGEPSHVATCDSDADQDQNYVLAEYLAGWPPAVALALADWLDAEATLWEQADALPDVPPLTVRITLSTFTSAEILARTCLGESA